MVEKNNSNIYFTIFQNTMEAILLATMDGDIISANPAACELFLLTEAEICKRGRNGLFDNNYPPLLDFINKRNQNGKERDNLVFLRGDGSHFIGEVSAALHHDDDGKILSVVVIRDISERLASEARILASEEKFRSVISSMAEGVVFQGPDGAVIEVNPAAERIEGRTAEQMMGHSSDDDMWGAIREDGSPFPGEEHPAMVTLRTGEPQSDVVMGILRPNGERRWISINTAPVFNKDTGQPHSVVASFHDITEKKQAEEALRKSEERFRTLIDHAPFAIGIARVAHTLYVNHKYLEMFRLKTKEDVIGHSLIEHWAPSARERIMKMADQRALGLPVPTTYEDLGQRADGSTFPLQASVVQVQLSDGPASVGFLTDLTERNQAEEKISNYIKDLENAIQGTLLAVSRMIEMRDPYTAGHEQRVGILAADIAREMGWAEDKCNSLQMIGLVHDIGKISIPAELLSKPTRLSELEYSIIQTHVQAGYEILKDVKFLLPIAEIIYQHHERMDGSGYPRGLKGNDILMEARILAVADVLESMSSHRPYRPSLEIEKAIMEIESGRGTIYDDQVVDACSRLFHQKNYTLPD